MKKLRDFTNVYVKKKTIRNLSIDIKHQKQKNNRFNISKKKEKEDTCLRIEPGYHMHEEERWLEFG